MKRLLLIFFIALGLTGCAAPALVDTSEQTDDSEPVVTMSGLPEPPDLFYPINNFSDRTTLKVFNQEVHDRFNGWHVGDDAEITEDEIDVEIAVYAMADGKLVYRNWVSGYGGVIVLQHEIGGQTLHTLYGHVDLSQTRPRLGDFVRGGTLITYLGGDKSLATDRERKHLHFGIYPGSALKLPGYVPTPAEVDNWINPTEYLKSNEAVDPERETKLPEDWKRHDLPQVNEEFRFSLLLPSDWEVQYVAESESLNLYQGAIDRSQIFIRRFDASTFLTLSTVTIHERHLNTIGSKDAVDYDIEKKQAVADFPNQPTWRNERHNVTDIRETPGFSRFYVFGQNPDLDEKTVYYILRSVQYVPADLQTE